MVKKKSPAPPQPALADGEAEQRILDAAHEVFIRRGTAGARMQEIADEAGVNKALLHYYFRNKSRLADAIFQRVAGAVFGRIVMVVREQSALDDKVRSIIAIYLEQLSKSPYAPGYILAELNHDPERGRQLVHMISGLRDGVAPSVVVDALQAQIDAGIRAGTIRRISAQQFLTNLVSLCIFPFAAKPLLCAMLGMDDAAFVAFIEERKRSLPAFFLNALRP